VKSTVLLFDVDGTLVTTCGAGRRAVERTFELRFGTKDGLSFSFAGMTDKAIVRTALRSMGWNDASGEVLEREIEATLAFYIGVLEDEIASNPNIRIHPGMLEAIDMADVRTDYVALGLGTGNIKRGAQIKLDKVGLFNRFAFGGFGDDSIDRPAILMAGARRGADHLNVPFERCRIVVIGDTPKDVSAAKEIGAESIAVATGLHDLAELRGCRPTFAFETLSYPQAPKALFGIE
jgi:beta-phosphoglucomutase-like phosphatase (HAD superfamily)